ncbi:MAG: hypothetical protein IJC35_04915 [Oscillospiraceae bacterium]|nr:hypothetical protein [Oscillospiraceae bacterium]
MNTIPFDHKDALVVAHRGVSGLERENTCAAFVAAANRSYFGIETDVHPTADGRFAIIHDSQTGRVAGDDLHVEGSTLAQLQALTLFDMDGTKSRRDLVIPALADYISICRRYGKTAVLELKELMSPDTLDALVEEICRLDYLSGVIFISFSLENLIHVRSRLPEQPLQYLVMELNTEVWNALRKYRLDLDIHYKGLTEENIRELKAEGITVNCWTVDDPADAERLAAWGVDQITSNILE